jgi:D-3-phosphoglycerate dehydrogenase
MKSLFIDCNDQLALVWESVVRTDDPPIEVNRKPFERAELPRLLQGYDICIDDHSYMPTELVAWSRNAVASSTSSFSAPARRAT